MADTGIGTPEKAPTSSVLTARVRGLQAIVEACRDEEVHVKSHLERCDDLDFEVFSKQRWDLLGRIHRDDVRVVWPDGHETRGLAQHEKDLSAMFMWMPDLRITSHPISFGAGDWTATVGAMEGTFSKTMPTADGKGIPPTFKRLNLQMVTIARWKQGRISDEYLFWDNAAFAKQIGLSS